MKLYFSYDENYVLTGYSDMKGCYSSTHEMGEIEVTEEEYDFISQHLPSVLVYDVENETIVYSEELQNNLMLARMEYLAYQEEQRTLSYASRVNAIQEKENLELKSKVDTLEQRLLRLEELIKKGDGEDGSLRDDVEN